MMDCAFDAVAFDAVAFDVCVPSPTVEGPWPRPPYMVWENGRWKILDEEEWFMLT